MKLIICLALLAVCLSCEKTGLEKGNGITKVELSECITQTPENDDIQICFEQVISDNRCPVDAVCIHQGNAIVQFRFVLQGIDTLHTLAIYPTTVNNSKVELGDYELEFVSLEPEPLASNPPPPGTKPVAGIRIRKI